MFRIAFVDVTGFKSHGQFCFSTHKEASEFLEAKASWKIPGKCTEVVEWIEEEGKEKEHADGARAALLMLSKVAKVDEAAFMHLRKQLGLPM
jgi:hypothetical protein